MQRRRLGHRHRREGNLAHTPDPPPGRGGKPILKGDKPMAAKRKKKLQNVEVRLGPTPEQVLRGNFAAIGMAHRRVPVIETMHARGMLSDEAFRRLAWYRDQALLAERSPVKSSLNIVIGMAPGRAGSERGPSAALVSAQLTVGRIERDLGSLAPLARAIAVDDVSLSQWCVAKHGGREKYDARGTFVAVVPLAEKRVMEEAKLELKMAAGRIVIG